MAIFGQIHHVLGRMRKCVGDDYMARFTCFLMVVTQNVRPVVLLSVRSSFQLTLLTGEQPTGACKMMPRDPLSSEIIIIIVVSTSVCI